MGVGGYFQKSGGGVGMKPEEYQRKSDTIKRNRKALGLRSDPIGNHGFITLNNLPIKLLRDSVEDVGDRLIVADGLIVGIEER